MNLTLFALEMMMGFYALGVFRCWLRAGVGHGIPIRQVIAFAGAAAVLAVALLSPLDAVSHELFSVHMIQHVILMFIAAPLLIACNYPVVFLYALPRATAHRLGRAWLRAKRLRSAWRLMINPVSAWTIFTVMIWLWHLPGLYQAALESDAVHSLEHACFIGSALIFWWVLIRPARRSQVHYAAAIPYLFLSAVQGSLLGALLSFSTQIWYPVYAQTSARWGLTPLQDQQYAGLIMWLPTGMLFTILAVLVLLLWFGAMERDAQQRTQLHPPSPELISK